MRAQAVSFAPPAPQREVNIYFVRNIPPYGRCSHPGCGSVGKMMLRADILGVRMEAPVCRSHREHMESIVADFAPAPPAVRHIGQNG